MANTESIYYIDRLERMPLKLELGEPGADGYRTLNVRLKLGSMHSDNFRKHFSQGLELKIGNDTQRFRLDTSADRSQTLQLETELAPDTNIADEPVTVLMKGQTLGVLSFDEQGQVQDDPANNIRRLTTFELRGLSRPKADAFPHDREALKNYDPDKHRPTTDLHTHLTSQISSQDLMELAIKNDIYYPVELLKKLGVEENELPPVQDRQQKPSYRFSPTATEGLESETGEGDVESVRIADLSDNVKERLERALSVPDDRVTTFNGIEHTVYRFRNPFTKNPDLIEPIILQVADDYQKQGVVYSEQAVTGALDPVWMEKAIGAVKKAEKRYGHTMRFLVGIPRTLSSDQMDQAIEKTKLIASSPYVAGVDFIGYEANKTHNFRNQLNSLAEWASEHPEYDFLIRVHAGETGKNLENVTDAMKVANNHGVRLRIGHGIHMDLNGDREVARKMAASGKLAVEFNPDSNMALNNIDEATDIPVQEWKDLEVPMLVATDGGGAYQCTLEDSAIAGLHAGLSVDDLANQREWEANYIEQQKERFEKKKKSFRKEHGSLEKFFDTYKDEVSKLSKMMTSSSSKETDPTRRVPEELRQKTPLLIAGASGSSWKKVSDEQKQEVQIGIRMLTELLDPEQVYFAVGRTKRDGVTSELDRAITKHKQGVRSEREKSDEKKMAPKFSLMGLVSSMGTEASESRPDNANHFWHLGGGLMDVSDKMVEFIKERAGAALYIGGSAFTRDFIHLSEGQNIPFGVMDKVAGASRQKARVLEDEHVFEGAIGMVEQVIAMQERLGKSLFKDGVDLSRDHLEEMRDSLRNIIRTPSEEQDLELISDAYRQLDEDWRHRVLQQRPNAPQR